MGGFLSMMIERGMSVPLLLAAGIVVIVLIRTVGSVVKSVSRERTRREIAAYIAEGSMSPEQGERLMRAGGNSDGVGGGGGS